MARTRQAIGRQNRARGQAFERLVAKELAKVWPGAKRNLSQVRGAKKEGGDILGTPYFVECKSGRVVSPENVWDGAFAVASPDGGSDPEKVIVVYRDGHRLMVCCSVKIRGSLVLAHIELCQWIVTQ